MVDPVEAAAQDIVDLYERRAPDWIVDRGAVLTAADRLWLDRFTADLDRGNRIVDIGCGSGRPMAATLLERGFLVTGVDSSARLVAHAAADLPAGRFVQADMRTLDLDETFDGVLAWHSLFHLTPADQRRALPRLLAHAAPRAVVMFSSGPREGHALGRWRGDPLYHGSLDPDVYRTVLESRGFRIDQAWAAADGVWLARRMKAS